MSVLQLVPAIRLRRAGDADLAAIEALQYAAYAPNRVILGVEPLPLRADYRVILRDYEVWLAEMGPEGTPPVGVLVFGQPEGDGLLIWSVAVAPAAQGHGVGNKLLAFAVETMRERGLARVTLYTGEKLVQNVDWYKRQGFVVTGREALADRVIVHMAKTLGLEVHPSDDDLAIANPMDYRY